MYPARALAVLLIAAGPPALASSAEALQRLAWLAGCWQHEQQQAGSVEHWLAPAGGTMLGLSRTVKGGETRAHEFLQIREVGGKLAYIALPSGQKEATFPLLSQEDRQVSFENPQHDFPQRVSYRLEAPGVLRARIEGLVQGKARAIDFPMRKVPCDGAG